MSTDQFHYSGNENLEIMRNAPRYNRALCDLVRRYRPEDTRVALDFGAGIGTFSHCPGEDAVSMVCVEPDPDQRRTLAEAGLQPAASLDEIGDNEIDYAFSLNVLEHIEDDFGACADLHRVLRPGGHLFIYVPAFPSLFTSMDEKVGHFRRYTRRSLREPLTAAGFTITKSAYYDFIGYFATLALKWANSSKDDGTLNPKQVRFYDSWVFPASRLLSPAFAGIAGKNLFVVATKT